MKSKRLLQGVLIVGAILLVFHDLTPQNALALLAVIAEIIH